jgi:cytochrome c biogenesis protein CcmG, thiol:disulfide interchange protein DsbE
MTPLWLLFLLSTLGCQSGLPSPVLLHAYSEGCRSCMEELPDFEAFAVSLAPKLPVRLLALSSHPAQRMFPVLTSQRLARHWGLFRVPETILIDKEGQVTKKWIGPQEWQKSVAKDSVFQDYLPKEP